MKGMVLMFNREETYSFGEFMSGSYKEKKNFHSVSLMPIATAPLWSTNTVFAAESMSSKMVDAFDPLIQLVQSLAYPVGMVVVLGGALFVMIGNKEKGFTLMQNAGLGYVLVQMMPMVLDILAKAMESAI